jgi:hypothetical protein
MVDLDAAIGFVVAHGDDVECARLAYLRTGAAPEPELLALVEARQIDGAGWPGRQGGGGRLDRRHLFPVRGAGRPRCAGPPGGPAGARLAGGRFREAVKCQGTDGSWPSDDGEASTVHTVLTAIRACRSTD